MPYPIVFGLVLMFFMLPAMGSGSPVVLVQETEAPEPMAIPPDYEYEPAGRRDPFVNPLTPEEQEEAESVPLVRPLGLPGVLLNEVELTAVVTSADPALNVVVVRAPGDRIFLARSGDELFDAVIQEIRSDIVVFEIKPPEGAGTAAPPEIVVRPLSARPGE